MILWKLILGIVLVLASLFAPMVCVGKTPNNLRGFYGSMFAVIALIGLVGGVAFIVTAFV